MYLKTGNFSVDGRNLHRPESDVRCVVVRCWSEIKVIDTGQQRRLLFKTLLLHRLVGNSICDMTPIQNKLQCARSSDLAHFLFKQ